MILFYVVLVVGVLEIGVRIARAAAPPSHSGWFWRVPDAVTGWSLQPNAQGRYFAPMYEYDVDVRINSLGLRADEAIGYAKPEDVFRVMVLGDSFIEALQVKLEESLPQRLGQLYTAQTGRPVEVLNAGVSGWGTDQQLLWLQNEGVKYSPDLIILAVYPRNDFMNNSEALEGANQGAIQKPFFEMDSDGLRLNYYPFDPANVPAIAQAEATQASETTEPGSLTALGAWLHDHSALYRYADPRIRIVAPRVAASLARTGLITPGQETKIAAQAADAVPVAYGVYQRTPDETWQAAEAVTASLFAAVQRTATEMGANAAALLIAAPEQVYDEEWQKLLNQYPAMQRWDTDSAAPQQRAATALTAAGLPVLDLLPLFREQAKGATPLHYLNDGHWTPQGHDLAGQATFNFLADAALLPGVDTMRQPLTVRAEARTWWEWIVLVVAALIVGSFVWDIVKTGPTRWLRKAGSGLSTAGELLAYMIRRRQYTLLPLVIILLLFAGLLILAQASVVGPFIYTLI
ncbi:MAG: SGNH/GDSL hydrolase family protein [Caldilineaceae bacterium]